MFDRAVVQVPELLVILRFVDDLQRAVEVAEFEHPLALIALHQDGRDDACSSNRSDANHTLVAESVEEPQSENDPAEHPDWQFQVLLEDVRCDQANEDASNRSADGNGDVIRGDLACIRLEARQFAVTEHTAEKQGHRIETNNGLKAQ